MNLDNKDLVFLPYSKQSITEEDTQSVLEVLRSSFLTQGPKVPEFELKVSTYVGSKFAVAVNSATSALHLSCMVLGLKQGDYLWTTPISFVASANCALYCGAKVDFVDINLETGLMSLEKLKIKLANAEKKGTLPQILVPVHLAGTSCQMDEIKNLSIKYGFKIIEDASHAIGGKYKNTFVGSCKYSDLTVFSFHPVKIITSGEGGMILTNNEDYAEKLKCLRSHGITKDVNKYISKDVGSWYYEQQFLGFNYRLSDVHAALGISQLNRLNKVVEKRNILFRNYLNFLKDLPLNILKIPPNVESSLHLCVIIINKEYKKHYKKIFEKLRSQKIGVQLHYIPIHLQPYYKNLGFKKGSFLSSEEYSQRAFSIPLFPDMSQFDQMRVYEILKRNFEDLVV
tara:strand:+ start:1048 stop:2241 length:1194 start_codon:yes stop_codon:yes gene_type:complete